MKIFEDKTEAKQYSEEIREVSKPNFIRRGLGKIKHSPDARTAGVAWLVVTLRELLKEPRFWQTVEASIDQFKFWGLGL